MEFSGENKYPLPFNLETVLVPCHQLCEPIICRVYERHKKSREEEEEPGQHDSAIAIKSGELEGGFQDRAEPQTSGRCPSPHDCHIRPGPEEGLKKWPESALFKGRGLKVHQSSIVDDFA